MSARPDEQDNQPGPEPEPWVDLVFESTPVPAISPRPGSPQRPTDKSRSSPASRKASERTAEADMASSADEADSGSTPARPGLRWVGLGIGLVACALVAVTFRPRGGHDPVPSGLLGVWATTHYPYETQTLEFLPDTVVLTLDNPAPGRYPIVAVETAPAGRETSVTITYRDRAGEKRLVFLADNEPTTVLRFREPEGLLWLRPAAIAEQ